MTSANVVHYRIFNKAGEQVGTHRQNFTCKPHWEQLLVFKPLDEHTIQAHGFNEEEESWEDAPVNLHQFLLNKRVAVLQVDAAAADKPKPIVVFGKLVPYCCEGEVKEVRVYEAPAYRYAIGASQLVDRHYACAKCGRTLPEQVYPG